MHDEDANNEEAEVKSKSELKREMSALQDLGRQLAEMKEAQWAEFPLQEDLRQALRDYQRIRKNEAKRRQLQYIGKLMRSADREGIQAAFDRISARGRIDTQREQRAEAWRDRLLAGNNDDLTAFFDEHPQADRQELRNLLRNAIQEKDKNQRPTQSRKLFRFIRSVLGEM